MKQPQLGQKIQAWRKAKGLTQEELVEKCNINVRTIQRIEAGEVTPRSYTVKAILEVLDVNPGEMRNFAMEEHVKGNELISWLRFSFIAGIVYLVLAVVESVLDIQLLADKKSFSLGLGYAYTFLKMAVLVLFVLFTSSFFKLGDFYSSLLLKVAAVMLMVFTSAVILEDIVAYWMGLDIVSRLIMRSLIAGLLYVLFAASLLHLSKERGTVYLIAGTLGILTGISFLTVIFAIPGLILLTLFEIVLVVLLYQEYKGSTMGSSLNFFSKEQAVL